MRDAMPLAEGAMARVKTGLFWMNLRFTETGDILSTMGSVVPEHYRVHEEENNHPASRIVSQGVLKSQPHKAMYSEFGSSSEEIAQ